MDPVKPFWEAAICLVAFTEQDLPDWWRQASFGKKAVSTLIGALSIAGVIFFAGVGMAQTFTEFRRLPDQVTQLDTTVQDHLLLDRRQTLRQRVFALEDQAEDFQEFHRWLGRAVGDLRCRALVTDGVYGTYSECWDALHPPTEIRRPRNRRP